MLSGARILATFGGNVLRRVSPAPKEDPVTQDPPTIGRQVHYVLQNGEHRSAEVVNVGPTFVNLTVKLDGHNDLQTLGVRVPPHIRAALIPAEFEAFILQFEPLALSVGSAPQDEDTKRPGTWHWPERAQGAPS